MTLSRIQEAVESLRTEYVEQGLAQSYFDINNGLCEDFAMDLMKKLRGITTAAYELSDASYMTGDGGVADGKGWDWSVLKESLGILPPAGLTCEEVDQINFSGHVWVEVDGVHFDAEAPEGVRSFFELPIFKRKIVACLRKKGVAADDVVTTDVVPAPLCSIPNPA